MRIDPGPKRKRDARMKAALRVETIKCSPKIKDRIVALVRGGCTLIDVCERDDMPGYSTIFEWRNADPDFDARLIEAHQALAEYMITEGTSYARTEADKEMVDTDRQRVMTAYTEVALKYAAAIAPRRFGPGVRLDVGGDNVPALQIVAFGQPITPINPRGGAEDTRLSNGQTQGNMAGNPADPSREAQSTGKAGNGSAGRRDSRRKGARKVQANRNTTRKAKHTKAQA